MVGQNASCNFGGEGEDVLGSARFKATSEIGIGLVCVPLCPLRRMTGSVQMGGGGKRIRGGGVQTCFWGGVLWCVFPSPEFSAPLCRSPKQYITATGNSEKSRGSFTGSTFTWWTFRPRKKKNSPPPPQISYKQPPGPSPPRPHPPGRPPPPWDKKKKKSPHPLPAARTPPSPPPSRKNKKYPKRPPSLES